MATETYNQIRSWIDSIFKVNGRKFITGAHANEGLKKVLAKAEELDNSKAVGNGLATLDETGVLAAAQRPPGVADENVKVGAAGVGDYLNEAYFERSAENHIRPKITEGKMLQGGIGNVPVEVNPPTAQILNIIANKGVGLAASKPVIGLVAGDIFVSTDSKLKFIATGATTWDAGVALTTGVLINDTSVTVNLLYQYNGTVVKLTGDGGSGGGGTSKWTALVATTDFATTAASTSTITMNADKTSVISVGMPLKFTLSGTDYYAIVTAITANLLTIAGAPLTTTASALTALSYSDLPNSTHTEIIAINGVFADALTSYMLKDDLLLQNGIYWKKSKAYCVQMSIICTNVDTGTVTVQAQLNAKINIADLLSSNLSVSTTLQNSIVQINTANYDINFGETIELELAALATGTPNHDAMNLTAYLIFVFP